MFQLQILVKMAQNTSDTSNGKQVGEVKASDSTHKGGTTTGNITVKSIERPNIARPKT